MSGMAGLVRFDRRRRDEIRPVKVTRNYIKHAEGAVLIEMGDTKVICTASVEEKVPPFLKGKGTGWVTAEYAMLPRATHERSPREAVKGKQGGRTLEIQRLVGRALRSVTDMSQLGERSIWIDCDVIQADGGTRTASITGAFIAYIAAMAEMLDRNRRAMGAIINMVIPEQRQYFEDYLDDDGVGMGPYKIACSMWREGGKAVFDFTGTDPQSISSVNFLLNEEMFKMFLGAFFINLFDPQILFNDGFYDLIDVHIPQGSILKPQRPAALSCRTHLLGRIFDVMGGLLGQGAPEALNAAGFSDSPHLMYSGYDSKGEWYQLFQIG